MKGSPPRERFSAGVMSAAETDIVVVGAGHNSLICAAYLAIAGLSVRVLEERDIIGGGSATEELTVPGFRHDPFSTGHTGLMANPAWADAELPLAAYGLRYVAPDPVLVLPAGDGDTITLWHDRGRTAAEFARFSSRDAAAWHKLCADWREIEPVFFDMMSHAPAAPGENVVVSQAKGAVRRIKKVLGAVSPLRAALMGVLAAHSATRVIAERFEHPEVRRLLLWLVGVTIGQPIDRAGTGMLAVAVPAMWCKYGWVNSIGGASALPEALKQIIASHGGETITGAKVERILVEGERASAVATLDGRCFHARKAIVSSMHVTLLPKALDGVKLPSEFTDKLAKWEGGPSDFNVHLALRENHRVRTRWGTITPTLIGAVSEAGLFAQLADIEAGRLSGDGLWLMASCSSVVDPSRAPPGKGVVKLTTMAPYSLNGDPANWDTAKEGYADRLVALYATLVEGFRPGDELGRAVVSPIDIQRTNSNFFGGSPQAGLVLGNQAGPNRPVAGWASYRMPVTGLYQTGASTHPGGAVTGWPGRNAARAVMEDLGLPVERWIRASVEHY